MKIIINALMAAALLGAYGCNDKPAASTESHAEHAGHDEAAEKAGHEEKPGKAGHDEHAGEDEHGKEGGGLVEITAAAQKEAGIKTETLKRASVAETFQAMGRVMQDAQKPHHVTAGGMGRLAELTAVLGAAVNAGDVLAVIKAPSGAETRVTAPHKGIVTAMHAAEGEQVNEMTFLFTLTDIDPLWGVLDIPERSLALVKPGQKAGIKTAAYPDAVFNGTIVSLSPEIDQLSRTVKARVSIENPAGLLKFGMFIDASVRTGGYFQGVAVRADAVQNGPDGAFVFVKTGETAFVPKQVVTGREKDGVVEIKKGLKPGEKVVVEGAFLLKSEMMKAEMGEDEHAH
ncbi:MAG: efflux RND transporter periplasmic adaptor subunit [Elusimicrobia bacterium]|nr:efflux RND transporter periplasmic adaptor subunit [Elusimicrobiota bacterium]